MDGEGPAYEVGNEKIFHCKEKGFFTTKKKEEGGKLYSWFTGFGLSLNVLGRMEKRKCRKMQSQFTICSLIQSRRSVPVCCLDF